MIIDHGKVVYAEKEPAREVTVCLSSSLSPSSSLSSNKTETDLYICVHVIDTNRIYTCLGIWCDCRTWKAIGKQVEYEYEYYVFT